ncbi:UNVERIFIED_CONTAM: hypothetical protein HDU68_009531 [Siphonaria sp. JEL0065]|nr:hypothetical protein HDU68_009531 [Siphonaria sp. JEL0065]
MQMVAAGTTALLSTLGGVFYFQPHRVISILVKQFPRIIWCLSSSVDSVRDPSAANTPNARSRTATPTPSTPTTSSSALNVNNNTADTTNATGSGSSLAWKEVQTIYASTAQTLIKTSKTLTKQVGTLTRSITARVAASANSNNNVQSVTAVATADDDGLVAMEEGTAEDPELLPIPGVSTNIASLTIDDSPSEHTAEILDILKQHGAKATFFIIGDYVDKLPEGPDLLARMVAEGHELANHTMFDRPTVSLTREIFELELVQVDSIISLHQPNPSIKWFRPGSGVFSQEMVDIAESYGYKTILGCRFPVDTTSRDPRLNSWHVASGIHPGAIVVLHDYREWIKETLRLLLPVLIVEKGYRVVTASELYHVACHGESTTYALKVKKSRCKL